MIVPSLDPLNPIKKLSQLPGRRNVLPLLPTTSVRSPFGVTKTHRRIFLAYPPGPFGIPAFRRAAESRHLGRRTRNRALAVAVPLGRESLFQGTKNLSPEMLRLIFSTL